MSAGPAPRVVLATHNAGKLRELRRILAALIPGFDERVVVSAGDLGLPDVVEDAVTFDGNALLKARAAARATGLVAVADDSGLTVDVLNGCPGIFSARWSGRHGDDAANNALLLAQLSDIAEEHRGAAFVCAAVMVDAAGQETVKLGRMPGQLLREPRGDDGIGYDPLFLPEGRTLTSAELSPEAKDAISHRGIALRALAPVIAAALA